MVSIEIQTQRKQADLEKKSYDDLLRERDILSKVQYTHSDNCRDGGNCTSDSTLQDLKKAEGATDKLQHLMKIRDQSIQTQQQEIIVSEQPGSTAPVL